MPRGRTVKGRACVDCGSTKDLVRYRKLILCGECLNKGMIPIGIDDFATGNSPMANCQDEEGGGGLYTTMAAVDKATKKLGLSRTRKEIKDAMFYRAPWRTENT